MLRHAFAIDNSTPGGREQVAKSIFESERAFYSRTQDGNDKTYNFDIENMTAEERQLMEQAEAILFLLASEATQKTTTPLKEKPRKPVINEELEALKAETAALRKTVDGIAELRKKIEGNGNGS
jgi:hypothetical protein